MPTTTMAHDNPGEREPGSEFNTGIEILRTDCGHSFATCHRYRCFRLPPETRAERDRKLNAAATEHVKAVLNETTRYENEKRQINRTYLNLAAEGEVDGWEVL